MVDETIRGKGKGGWKMRWRECFGKQLVANKTGGGYHPRRNFPRTDHSMRSMEENQVHKGAGSVGEKVDERALETFRDKEKGQDSGTMLDYQSPFGGKTARSPTSIHSKPLQLQQRKCNIDKPQITRGNWKL